MSISELQGTSVPIKLWINYQEVEESALKQLYTIAALPWVFKHVAVMPDVHWGNGATVGSVIAMKNAITPAAVGVDIGCFSGDTEVSLADGGKATMADMAVTDSEYLVYVCTDTGRILASKAKAFLTRTNAEIIEISLDDGSTIKCTPDHKFMLRDGSFLEAENLKVGISLMPLYLKLDKYGYPLVQQPYSGRWQKVHWMIARAGLLGPIPRFEGQRTVIHHRNFKQNDNRPENLQFMGNKDHSAYHSSIAERNQHFQSAEFEKRRREAIRKKASTPDGYAYYAARGTANIRKYMEEHREEFLAAVSGNGGRGKEYLVSYNRSERGRRKSSEVAHREYTCELCGVKMIGGFGVHNHKRKVHQVNHTVVSIRKLEQKEDVYCLSVPEYGNFALSAGVFVHNCGMAAIKTSMKASQLPDNLKPLREAIEDRVPVGFNWHPDDKQCNRFRHGQLMVDMRELWKKFDTLHENVQSVVDKARLQMGTLGGGNHFLEVCLDTDQNVWIMLHSGSRNIGNELAKTHMDIARKLIHNRDLPDQALAVFLSGTPEMDAYRRDLFWAQEYARLNRYVMIGILQDVMKNFFPKIEFQEAVHCHHNYVSEENHFGEDLLVTRKGAISARLGEMGLIPGSMGTQSFVVRGKGNEESFHSAPHGAGRRMSRGAAKKHFTAKDLKEQTEGVECRKDTGVLDEIPGAYKNVKDVVRKNSVELVEVVAELKQVLCVKG